MNQSYNNPLHQFPGNIYCKDTDGVIIWHNYRAIQDFNIKIGIDNLIGKTIDDLFCPLSAEKCRNDDLEVINNPTNNPVCIKQEKLALINLKIHNYLTITNPLVNHKGKITGIMISTINTQKLHEQKFIDQKLYNYYIFMLKEILIIMNLMKLAKIKDDLLLLSAELQSFAGKLLINSRLYTFIDEQLLLNCGNINLKI